MKTILDPSLYMEDITDYSKRNIEPIIVNSDAEEDFKQSRENLKRILEIGSNAINEMADIAKSAQRPDGYEALAKLVKELGDSSEKLLKVHQEYEKILNKSDKASKNDNIYMSTRDVGKLVKELSGPTEIKRLQ